jgi:ribosomal protein L37AE/L43A
MSEQSADGMYRKEFCDFCKRNFPENELEVVFTIRNGIEQREHTCPGCENQAREIEKPTAMTDGGQPESDTYYLTESGTKWPKCLICGSEDTVIVPKTGEWTCEDCGHQWHDDETVIDASDAGTIGDEIEMLLKALGDESPRELARVADEKGVTPGDCDE